jgi:hypothetical protein
MKAQTGKMILNGVAAACLAASALVVWAAAQPLDRAAEASLPRPGGTHAPQEVPPVTLASLGTALDTDLRRPLVDRPAPPPVINIASDASAAGAPSIQLVGTIIEQGHSMALISGTSGKIQLKAVGESVDGAEITAIADDGLTVKWNGAETRVPLRRASGTAAAPVSQPGDEDRR